MRVRADCGASTMFKNPFTRTNTMPPPLTPEERRERRLRTEFAFLKSVILTCTCIILFALFGGEAAVFWTLFFAFLVFRWDSRYIGGLAILALTACPVLLSLELEAEAEQMAVYAYYFLVMTVVLQIIEFKRHPETFAEGEKDKLAGPSLDLRTVRAQDK